MPIEDVELFDDKMEPERKNLKIIKVIKVPGRMQFVREIGSDIK